MYTSAEKRPARGFWTPPATWNHRAKDFTATTLLERKRTSPSDKSDHFHIHYKVPSGDSPYVKAKRVQLIDKEPSRAISLFWAAINAGDRIESALKDMTVVMKQLNRSDEAIEAIKSFRHFCHYDSQDSLDNLLLELYKKSGRVDEEAELLERKLKSLEGGTAFGGKSMKTKRCQGKQIAVTIEQEKARLLGNLAWVHLQQHNYGIAEQHYRKALSLEPDKNKQCNLAICLMRMNKVAEAKSLLQNVRDSSGDRWDDDEPYSKSFERAVQTLNEIESNSETVDFRSNAFTGSLDSERFYRNSGCEIKMNENRSLLVYEADPVYIYPSSSKRNSGGLFTQPRKCIPGFEDRRSGNSVRRLSFEKTPVKELIDECSALSLNGEEQGMQMNANAEKEKIFDQRLIHGLHEFITGKSKPGQDGSAGKFKKSWADMVEEDEAAGAKQRA